MDDDMSSTFLGPYADNEDGSWGGDRKIISQISNAIAVVMTSVKLGDCER
jgi:hypothetical protein